MQRELNCQLTCNKAGGLDIGAAMRLAVMPGNGLKLPAPA